MLDKGRKVNTFKSEQNVIDAIASKLLTLGVTNSVTVHSDTQDNNTVVRDAVFKVAIAVSNSSVIVDKMSDIAVDTDRAIYYKGSQVTPATEGEMRYLFFSAKINPYKV